MRPAPDIESKLFNYLFRRGCSIGFELAQKDRHVGFRSAIAKFDIKIWKRMIFADFIFLGGGILFILRFRTNNHPQRTEILWSFSVMLIMLIIIILNWNMNAIIERGVTSRCSWNSGLFLTLCSRLDCCFNLLHQNITLFIFINIIIIFNALFLAIVTELGLDLGFRNKCRLLLDFSTATDFLLLDYFLEPRRTQPSVSWFGTISFRLFD